MLMSIVGWLKLHIILLFFFFFFKNPDWGISNHLKLCWLPVYIMCRVRPDFMKWRNITQWGRKWNIWWTRLLLQSTIWIKFSVHSLSYICIILLHQKRQTKARRITASSLTSSTFDYCPVVCSCVWTCVLLVQRPMNWNIRYLTYTYPKCNGKTRTE